MPVYKQLDTYTEDGFGAVTIEFLIADEYDLLFTQTGVETVDIFTLGSIKEDTDDASGAQRETEFEFSMSAAAVFQATGATSAANSQCFMFTLQAESSARYVAVFINPASTGDISALAFSGLVRRELSGTDLLWGGDQWGTAPDPIREWKLKAQSIGAAALDHPMDDEADVDGILTELAADTDFTSANVADRDTYTEGAQTAQLRNIVNLNLVLLRLIEISAERTALSIPGFTLTPVSSWTSYAYTPAEPQIRSGSLLLTGYESIPAKTTLLQLLYPTNALGAPWIHWWLVDPKEGADYSFRRYKTLTDLLYALAPCWGCYFEENVVSSTEVEYRFVPRTELATTAFYLRDAVSASVDVSATTADERDTLYASAGDRAVEGLDVYRYTHTATPSGTVSNPVPSTRKQVERPRGELLPLSLSPTLASRQADLTQSDLGPDPLLTPHNSITTARTLAPEGAHTALYMYVNIGGSYFWRPAIEVRVKADDSEAIFALLEQAVEYSSNRDQQFYEREYNIETPYLCGFSASSDGGSPAWQAVRRGYKITLDGREYVVVGIERDLGARRTKLRLHYASRYSFTEPGTTGAAKLYAPGGGIEQEQGQAEQGEAYGAIAVGDAVGVVAATGEIFRMEADGVLQGSYVGIALDDAAEAGDPVRYAGPGSIISNPAWSFSPGDQIFVRTATHPASNLSTTPLTEPDEDESLYLRIGTALSATRIALNYTIDAAFEEEA